MKTTIRQQFFLLLALLLAGVNSASAQFARGDVNGDGVVDITDVTVLVDYIHGTAFPKAVRTISFATPTSVEKTFGDAAFTNAATPSAGAGDGTLSYESSETSVATVDANTGEVTIAGVGSTTITASITAGDTYAAASNTYTLTVAASSISPTVTLANWTYGTPNEPSVSGNTGNGAVTYYYKVKGTADDTYSATKPTTVGDYTVKASIAATTNYQAAETAAVDFSITQKTVTVTGGITAESKVYDGTTTATLVLTGATFDGVVTGDEVTVASATGTFATSDVGTGITVTISDIVLGGADVANYTLATSGNQASTTADITGASFAPVVTLTGWTYGSPNSPSVSGNPSAGNITYQYKTGDAEWTTTQPTAVGTHQVKASIAANGNYAAAETAAVDFSISQLEAVLSWSNTELTYNGSEQKPTCTVTNVISGDECTVTVTGGQTDHSAEAYTATAESLSNSNYKLPSANTTSFTIAKANPTYTAPAYTALTYTGSAQNLVSTGTTSHGTFTYSTTEDGTYSETIPQGTDAGSYTVWYKLTGDANHNDVAATQVTGVSIAKAACTVSLDKTSLNLTKSSATGTITVTRDGDGTVTAESSNTSVATVSVSGNTVSVTAKANGSATITIKVSEGSNHTAYTATDKTVSVTCTGFTVALALGDKYYSDGTWGNNTHASGATVIGIVAWLGTDSDLLSGKSHGLVMALNDCSSTQAWGGYGNDESFLNNTSTIDGCRSNDKNGLDNTQKLNGGTGGCSHGHAAANAAANYTPAAPTSNGATSWFLPSAAQWLAVLGPDGIGNQTTAEQVWGTWYDADQTAYNNIKNALTASGVGGTALQYSNYWSSSEYGSYYAVGVRFGSSNGVYVDASGKGYTHYVRAFLAF
ncbi:MAG: Ig-like domain-containing protein [Prevotella sp.]|nr:Ig-like domain-containing protein [Prevotella sp.]